MFGFTYDFNFALINEAENVMNNDFDTFFSIRLCIQKSNKNTYKRVPKTIF